LTCNKPDENSYSPGFDLFTSNLGFVIFGLFTFISVTVLINTLIAMMEETIDTIDDRADVEWKFSRSRLYMEYIRDGKNHFFNQLESVIKYFGCFNLLYLSRKSKNKRQSQGRTVMNFSFRKYFTCSNEYLSNTEVIDFYNETNKTTDIFK
jgi:hypothetical protein